MNVSGASKDTLCSTRLRELELWILQPKNYDSRSAGAIKKKENEEEEEKGKVNEEREKEVCKEYVSFKSKKEDCCRIQSYPSFLLLPLLFIMVV